MKFLSGFVTLVSGCMTLISGHVFKRAAQAL